MNYRQATSKALRKVALTLLVVESVRLWLFVFNGKHFDPRSVALVITFVFILVMASLLVEED